MTEPYLVLGLQEIADLLGTAPKTPHTWLYRGNLPTPDYERVNGHPAWDRDTILRWAKKTNRLPDHLRGEV